MTPDAEAAAEPRSDQSVFDHLLPDPMLFDHLLCAQLSCYQSPFLFLRCGS